jgi:hypothetical protein
MHEQIINVLTSNIIYEFVFFRLIFELVEAPVGSKCSLCKKWIVDLADIQETLSLRLRCIQRITQRIMEQFKFKLRVKTRILFLVS